MKTAIPLPWHSAAVFRALVQVLIARNLARLYRRILDSTVHDKGAAWWTETKRQIDRGYLAFCRRRGLDPNLPEWNGRGLASPGEARTVAAG